MTKAIKQFFYATLGFFVFNFCFIALQSARGGQDWQALAFLGGN